MSVWFVVSIPTVEREKELRPTAFKSPKNNGLHVPNPHNIPPANQHVQPQVLPLKSILENVLSEMKITDAVWCLSKIGTSYHIYFSVELDYSDEVLEVISSHGIGSQKETNVGIIPFSFFMKEGDQLEDNQLGTDNESVFGEDNEGYESHSPHDEGGKKKKKFFNFKSMQEKFLKSMTARLTVAQVVSNVRSGAELTFDFIMYVILAAWIAAMGLLESSVVNTVASMLVSPMMGPVMAMTFGAIIRDHSLRNLGIRNALIGFMLCILFGFTFGGIALNFTHDWNPLAIWPTGEMQARGQLRVLWVAALVAIPSGAAVAVSILSGNQSSLGLLWSFALIKAARSTREEVSQYTYNGQIYEAKPALQPMAGYIPEYYPNNMAMECFILGFVSMGLTIVNVLSIFFSALIILKIKEVGIFTVFQSPNSRFWKEDIKIARDYNLMYRKTSNSGENFLTEWAEMTGLDHSELMKDSPEARAAQLQTLQDMMRDVQSDEVYRSIKRSTSIFGLTPEDNIPTIQTPSTAHPGTPIGPFGRKKSRLYSSFGAGANSRRLQTPQIRKNSVFTLEMQENLKKDGARELRKSLMVNDHQPMSVWPTSRPRSPSRLFTPQIDVSRRFSVVPRSRMSSSGSKAETTEMTIFK